MTEDQKAGIAFVSKDFPKEWQNILKLRYIDLLTLDDIAAQKGITRERVRQIALKALKRLEEYESSEYVVSGLQTSQQKAEREQNDRLLFDRSIDELNLSGRAHNCLMRAGYTTIGEVVLARNELIKIKNIGKHIVEEIWDKIDLYTKDFMKTNWILPLLRARSVKPSMIVTCSEWNRLWEYVQRTVPYVVNVSPSKSCSIKRSLSEKTVPALVGSSKNA